MSGASTRVATVVGVYNVTGHVNLRDTYFDAGQAATLRHNIWPRVMDVANSKYPGESFPEPKSEYLYAPQVSVPDVLGLAPEAAQKALEAAGFGWTMDGDVDSAQPKGTIGAQNPSGTASKGSVISLKISRGNVSGIPDVTGQPADQAEAALTAAGFRVDRKEEDTDRPDEDRRGALAVARRGRERQARRQGDHRHRPGGQRRRPWRRRRQRPRGRLSTRLATRLTPVARIAIAIGAAGAAAFAYGSLVERTRFTLRRADVAVLPRWRRADQGAAPVRPAHGAVATRQAGLGARSRRPEARPHRRHRRQPRPRARHRGHPSGVRAVPRRARRVRERIERLLRTDTEEPVHVLHGSVEARRPGRSLSTSPRCTRSSPTSAGRTSTTPPRASTSTARTSSSSASTTRTRAMTAST